MRSRPGRDVLLASLVTFGWETSGALAQSATTDPAGSGPILAALQWIEGTLMGNVATTAAVIAVAVVGLMMLTGRIDWRRGLVVVLGAFIVFGAAAIVEGMRSIVQR
jgi:type IV secretion system protein VirB2